ncbi:MAG: hypothetical protein DRQ48_11250 [Gammaproteobacteria bacterium]|nr:MAG: hypothetical protein DRQ48_11250 [Gammaproteobacteria bacterium]
MVVSNALKGAARLILNWSEAFVFFHGNLGACRLNPRTGNKPKIWKKIFLPECTRPPWLKGGQIVELKSKQIEKTFNNLQKG